MSHVERNEPRPESADDGRTGASDEMTTRLGAPARTLDEWLRAQIRNAPWWLISVAVHALALACLTLITFSAEVLSDEPHIVVISPAKALASRPDIEKPRGLFDQDGLKPTSETPAAEHKEIYFPDAALSDHYESADHEDTHDMKGDDPKYMSYLPGQEGGAKGRDANLGRGLHDAIGTGGGRGGAGRFSGRTGGGRENLRPIGWTPGSESAVTAGLRWLARHQAADGRWSAGRFDAECAGPQCAGHGYPEHDVGVTGLALLAFLGAGQTHLSRATYTDRPSGRKLSFGQCVKKGVDYLISVQDAEGCFGSRTGDFMYSHSIAALAMAEAYGLTNAAAYRVPAQRGIDFVTQAQNPYLGWRYHVKPGDNDTSVTGWCVMALKSAELSGLTTSRSAFDGASAWLDRVTDKTTGIVGYNGPGRTDVIVKGKNEEWGTHPSMTAVGMLCRMFIDKDANDPLLHKGGRLIVKDLPQWDERRHTIDSYYWYYATLALFLYSDGPGAKLWSEWNETLKELLPSRQKVRADGCADGSWDPGVDRWGFAGGRVYMTAINVLTLEVYYRYDRFFGAKAR